MVSGTVMSTHMNSSQQQSRWRSVSLACVLWSAGGMIFGGIVPAALSTEQGAFPLFIVLGTFVGICGAAAHSCLFYMFWFRRQTKLAQALALWLFTLFLFWLAASIVSVSWALEFAKSAFFMFYMPALVLVAAVIVNYFANLIYSSSTTRATRTYGNRRPPD